MNLDKLKAKYLRSYTQIHLIFTFFLVDKNGDDSIFGWYAHPYFNGKSQLNEGSFEVSIWKPPILEIPINLKLIKKMKETFSFQFDDAELKL